MVKVFISSVQREFAAERREVAEYIRRDAVMRRFFEPFLVAAYVLFMKKNYYLHEEYLMSLRK